MSAEIDRTILIVDDDAPTRATLQDLLEHDGFHAMGVPDGFVAARVIRQKTIDLVFLDVDMPGKSGIEVLREIRIINEMLPVVMLTGTSDTDIFQWALEAGAFSMLPKPVDIEQIRVTLQHALFGFQL
jgi:DNA-binding response OmpR family regulator